jgi:hypothetical protein
MSTIDIARAGPELMQRWRQQVGGQRHRRDCRGPRLYAAISYVARGPIRDGLVDLRRVAFVVVQDILRRDGSLATRFRNYAATAVPWGVKIGGAENTRFDKDLSLAPRRNATGRAFAFSDTEFLGLSLDLDRYMERHYRFPGRFGREPRLPVIWAAFAPKVAQEVRSAGPEFEAAGCQRILRTVSSSGASLIPVDHVSHEWRRFGRMMVDLRSVPKRQLVAVDHRGANLAGFMGAIAFDLRQSRFSPGEAASA